METPLEIIISGFIQKEVTLLMKISGTMLAKTPIKFVHLTLIMVTVPINVWDTQHMVILRKTLIMEMQLETGPSGFIQTTWT
jgi:hypothetical protein